ncbi:MAG TPA: substrate-binding domain-containing protein [Tepidisphaeraceae bacterium]|jgi:DNA-binding LacI/PurR family transcriptional regulator|nr:substrate-binding domain-containing protein [Tepidisphaeraceae bacterium]
MSNADFILTEPLPGRNAFEVLRKQLREYILNGKAVPGELFLSDHELVRRTGLSRNTVRKSLDLLVREGLLERRQGTGTFVGPRIVNPAARLGTGKGRSDDGDMGSAPAARDGAAAVGPVEGLVRLALLLGYPAGPRWSWYSFEVIQGLEQSAVAERLSIDLLGCGLGIEHVRRRLEQIRPDVLACLSPHQEWAMLVAEAKAMGIPVLLTGSRLAGMGIPTIREDGVGGAKLAVQRLVGLGHQRIAFIQDMVPAPWAFERYRGYVEAMTEAGLDPDEDLCLWINQEERKTDDGRLARFLRRRRPTAVVVGSASLLRVLTLAVVEVGLMIPGDLSVIVFDQAAREASWFPGQTVTTVALPLEATGRLLAQQAREAAAGQLPQKTSILPCTLLDGTTDGPVPA